MQQRSFDFDQLAQSEPAYVAETTSLPPPELKKLPPLLVRPDRQFTFDGLIHYEWPPAEHDHDTITVDRIREDIDGPSHRFLICRGDTVEVFFGTNHTDTGEVTGISHRNREVRVAFLEGSDGIWVETSRVYPTLEVLPRRSIEGVPLSEVIAAVNCEPPGGFTEADRVPTQLVPYTFEEYRTFRRAFSDGSLTYSDYQEQFARVLQSQDAIVSEIASLTPASFKLDAAQPTVTVAARHSKHRKKDTLPIHADLVKEVRMWLAGLATDEPLFPLLGKRKAYKMIQRDLEEAEIPYETEEGLADFHAAGRHTHITELLRSGVSLVEARRSLPATATCG